jgi:putative hydrolase of the HAD superfamily
VTAMASTIRAILFDLDDTLYFERDYVRSGFSAVAEELANRGVGKPEEVCQLLEQTFYGEGRERVLDKLADRLAFPREWVPQLVQCYRSHAPRLTLPDDVRQMLGRLRRAQYRLGCITDGWKEVQRAKIKALGIAPLLDAVVITDDYGRDKWKPSPFPFVTCCQALEVRPEEAVYVGDNPERDMCGARAAGITSVRVRHPDGYFCGANCGPNVPDYEITTLAELEPLLARDRRHLTGERVC